MTWNQTSAIRQLEQLLKKKPAKFPVRISVQSEYGSGTAEMLDTFVSRRNSDSFFINRFDFRNEQHRPAHWQLQTVWELFRNGDPLFLSFLNGFTKPQQRYIEEILNSLPEISPERKAALQNLFFHFFHSLGQTRKFIFIFENTQEIDRLQAEVLRRELDRLSVLPLFIIYSGENIANHQLSIAVDHRVVLPRLSVREVAQNIRDYFSTSAINARIITNNCYFKTSGDPLKTRLLLEGHYRRFLAEAPDGFINIKQMQCSRVSGDWHFVLEQLFNHIDEQTQITLSILAYLGGSAEINDFKNILRHFRFSDFSMTHWVRTGLLRQFTMRNSSYIGFSEHILQDWFYQFVPAQRLKKHLQIIYDLHVKNKLSEVYKISHLFYEVGETEFSLKSARRESAYLIQLGRYREAAERLYFLVRHSDIYPDSLSDFHYILQLLGEVYLKLGVNENAFEILRRLRDEKIQSAGKTSDSDRDAWVDISLKIARALIKMDAFQEAKYILRDVRSKKFCLPRCKGNCYQLLGDIELNFNRKNVARKNYLEALKYYREKAAPSDLLLLYKKLKGLIELDESGYQAFLSILQKMPVNGSEAQELYCYLLRDRVKYRVKNGLPDAALHTADTLSRELRNVYHPQLVFQISLLLAEIYSLRGKWKLAVSHLDSVITHPVIAFYPALSVQVYIQSALVYKEQAIYGEAERLFKKAMEICRRKGYSLQQNEIKLHLGHIYLLVHSLPRAREFLKQVHDSAEKFQQTELLTLAKLYLSYYEMKHKKWESARGLLREANTLIKSGGNKTDRMNYLYYIGLWLLETGSHGKAAPVIRLFTTLAADNPRYLAAAGYLEVKLLSAQKAFTAAERRLRDILKITQEQSLPQVRYLLLCEAVWLLQKIGKKRKLKAQLKETCTFIRQMAQAIGDTIFTTQFIESRYHEDILQLCKKQVKEVDV